jgi:NADPH:quinone reductase-like Zn-dependent oxidoreductase
MKRIQYDRYGGPEVIQFADFDLPNVTGSEVMVRVAAASINPFDWKVMQGELRIFTGSKFPRAMGSDFSGTVEKVGPKVSRFRIGDQVVGTVAPKVSGAFAPKLITEEKLLVNKPAALSHAEAATLPIPGVTAWLALVKKANMQTGQRLFLNGAMGGVGLMALSIARDLGISVAGRVGSSSLSAAKARGLSPALDYAKAIPSNLQGSFDVVFDCNGSLSPKESGMLVKPGGVVIDINLSKAKLISFLSSWRQKLVFFNGDYRNLQPIVDLAGAGRVPTIISRTVTLEDAIPLITSLEQGNRTQGKCVILLD